jgi:hypothetical protein
LATEKIKSEIMMRNWIAKLLGLPTEAQLEADINTATWMVGVFVETTVLANQMADAIEKIAAKRIPTAADRQAAADALAAYRARGRKV